jgi:uncharacterized RDD family membrane protein YckC
LVFCPACGKENAAGATFCANCGKPLTAAAATPTLGGMSLGSPAMPAPGGMKYAEIIDRFVGALIDYIIIAVIGAILGIIIFAGALASGGFGFFFGPIFLIEIVLWLIYFTYFEGTTGQTFGKQIAHTKVVDERTGQTVDMGRAFIRSLLRIIDELPFFYIIGVILVAVTPNRQRLGDMAAHTVVVKV